MVEDNKYKESDLLMRSILENAQEEVPEGIWDAISEDLDKASRRKTVVLMWRRAAAGVGIAAVLAVGLVLNHGRGEGLVPEVTGNDMIAVVETPETAEPEEIMIAQVSETAVPKSIGRTARYNVPVRETAMPSEFSTDVPVTGLADDNQIAEAAETPSPSAGADVKKNKENNLTYQYKEEYMPSEWEEDGDSEKVRRKSTSLVLSGIAGTNGTRNTGKTGLLRQPSISTAPPVTGIKETSTKSTYGIPLSFGAGVKIGLTEKWSLGAGVNYTLLTRRFYGTYTKVNSQGSIEMATQSDIRNIQHYLGIPVNVFYDIVDTRHMNFYAYAGGTVEKCLSDKYQLLGKDITHTEKVKGVQLSANLGIGVEFLLGNHLGLYIDPSLRYYFDNGQPSSIRTAQPLMLGFEMGLRVKL